MSHVSKLYFKPLNYIVMNWIVLYPQSRKIYYEAISEADAKANCPTGYKVLHCSDAYLEELVLSY